MRALLPERPAVIFDLDGTLWDGLATIYAAWQETLAVLAPERYLDLDFLKSLMGKSVPEIRAAVFPDLPVAEGNRLLAAMMDYENELVLRQGGQLYEGLETCLQQLLPRYNLMIVSNCGTGYIEAFLAHYNLDSYFVDTENNGATQLPKAENIALIKQRNGLEQAVYVGDTEGDCRAAAQSAVPFIWASYGFGAQVSGPCLARLEHLAALPALLQKHFGS